MTSEQPRQREADAATPGPDNPGTGSLAAIAHAVAPQPAVHTQQSAVHTPDSAVPGPETTVHEPVRVLGERYELGEVIGRGGMSTVHRAHDRLFNREVAVKVFRPGTDLHGDRRYRREVQLLSALNAPGLVTVLDADLGETASLDTMPYLVTELVDGLTLSQRIKQSRLTEEQTSRLGAVLCRTLAYVHQQGIVHRDVKPSNILIPADAVDDLSAPKLADFGIAVAADDTRLTMHNSTVGTANYLSPEQVRGEIVTPASDIYSLGLVLIEALTGEYAYPGTGLETLMVRLNRPPTIPQTSNPALRALLVDMTNHDPPHRPDASGAADRLDRIATEPPDQFLSAGEPAELITEILPFTEPVAAPPAWGGGAARPPVEPANPRDHRRALFALVGAAVAVAAALITVASLVKSTSHKPPIPVDQTTQQAAPPIRGTHSAEPSSTPERSTSQPVGPPNPAPTSTTAPAPSTSADTSSAPGTQAGSLSPPSSVSSSATPSPSGSPTPSTTEPSPTPTSPSDTVPPTDPTTPGPATPTP